MSEEFKNPFGNSVNDTPTEPIVNAEVKVTIGDDGVVVDPNEEPVVKDEGAVVTETATAEESVEYKPPVPSALPAKTAKQMVLEEYGGLESNVPINSAYWNMK